MTNIDIVWDKIYKKAQEIYAKESILRNFLDDAILKRDSFIDALSHQIAINIIKHDKRLSYENIYDLCKECFINDKDALDAISYDIDAVCTRDPAVLDNYVIPFLYLKGPHALWSWRVSHYLWEQKRFDLARFFQSIISDVYAVDIHPAAKIGKGIMLDHATGIVIGETAVVGDNVSILQDVTLGGTGKEDGDRHPKIASGVMIGSGAKVLGNIKIGEGAKIGANSVVLNHVEPHTTVAGIPARVVGKPKISMPSLSMDQNLDQESEQKPICTLGCGVICSKNL